MDIQEKVYSKCHHVQVYSTYFVIADPLLCGTLDGTPNRYG
jgi:hypothetical protein